MFVMRHSKSPHASQPQRGPIAISSVYQCGLGPSDMSLCHSLLPNAHGPIFCRKELREKVGVKVRLLDRFFYRTEVRAHGPIFCWKQLREIIGAILYSSKNQRTRTDFHTDFLSGHLDVPEFDGSTNR